MSKAPVKPRRHEKRTGDGKDATRLPGLHSRLRARRVQLGLTGAELAQRAGISASYVSLIENAAKVPDEEVAAGLARALHDEESLYRGWARAARLGLHDLDLLNRLEAIARTPAFNSLVESGQELPRMEAPPRAGSPELAARLREVAFDLGPVTEPGTPATRGVGSARAVEVPVIAEGADPVPSPERPPAPVLDRLLLDRRLLPEGVAPEDLFAYVVGPRALKHLSGVAAPGDWLVLRRGGAVQRDRVSAVRTSRGIVLARVMLNDRALLLLPGDGGGDFESVEVGEAADPADLVAGTQALLIRR